MRSSLWKLHICAPYLNWMSPKTVAIIGAGPGGLVTAKTFLHSHPRDTFQVTVFEKSNRIGGIWSVTRDQPDGIVPLDMPTNLSRFAVAFSDLDWSSLDLPKGKPIHMHPKAWQVNAYLEEYARRYIPRDTFQLSTKVTSIEKGGDGGWKIRYQSSKSPVEAERHFDFCILASGFYAKAQPLGCQLVGFDVENSPVKLVHSSLYRNLDDVLPDGSKIGTKIIVIGGANSGGEAAAALAFDLSNRQFAPEGQEDGYDIVHIMPQPVYGLPLFVPSADRPGSFVPLDVRFYDLSKRPDQPLKLKVGRHTDDSKKMLHGLIQGMLGSDPHENGLQHPLEKLDGGVSRPKAAIQDNWASFVRSGNIKLQSGRVTSLQSNGPGKPISATVQSSLDPDHATVVDGIAGVIYATGYSPEAALSILEPSVLDALSYDPKYPRLPLLLPEDSLASNPAVATLGFVGLYEGPYWGVMEMQARQLAQRWTSLPSAANQSMSEEPTILERTQNRLDSLLDIRSALKDELDLVPQYIFSDYTAIMEESSRDLNLTRNDGPCAADQGPITPARYLDSGSNKTEADKTIHALHETIRASAEEGRFIPRSVFRGLQGRWNITRELHSEKPEYPTGVFKGEAWFHPRKPTTTTSNNDTLVDKEYLYLESGTLNTNSGLTIPAYKTYVWRFSEEPEKISVWFVKMDARTVDYLYHELNFSAVAVAVTTPADDGSKVQDDDDDDDDGRVEWRAKGDHLCEADMYWTEYAFVFNGVAVEKFEVVHRVKGPNKDYVSKTVYTR
ncbi:MAG: hypothetical protein GOMPHAMPRED_005319 [Gomphillus americanus]|uniref:DUF6314 domain-containing protein n=1 Tax=Gomphillus americanus TaxID=1940652 RepID=A0A8H3FQ42_9LECA|nr:MAG: hypothetical protein GOMPHAMPRED_005319 [Gomphillus americanus]